MVDFRQSIFSLDIQISNLKIVTLITHSLYINTYVFIMFLSPTFNPSFILRKFQHTTTFLFDFHLDFSKTIFLFSIVIFLFTFISKGKEVIGSGIFTDLRVVYFVWNIFIDNYCISYYSYDVSQQITILACTEDIPNIDRQHPSDGTT